MQQVLALSPSGQLSLQTLQSRHATGQMTTQAIDDQSIAGAFKTGIPEGLFVLAKSSERSSWPTALHYWRAFAVEYFNRLCQQSDGSLWAVELPSSELIDQWLLQWPPMLGAEYLDASVLVTLWSELDDWVRHQVANTKGGLSAFIAKELSDWHPVGRVCFHLAENKDATHPFAFMATYIPATGKKAAVQYRPLATALQDYAGKQNNLQLVNLLQPIHEAATHCDWVKALLKTRDIYHPLAWTPQEAYKLLRDIPLLEKSGLMVRVPDWWKKRPRPTVQVVIGKEAQPVLSADTLLDFDVEVALGDAALTAAEIDTLLNSEGGLVSLRGQWVEVDAEKLEQALAHWQQLAVETAGDGLSFIEGMRLLAGADARLSGEMSAAEDTNQWAYINAGSWLDGILKQVRQPSVLQTQETIPALKAHLRPYQRIGVEWLNLLTELGLGACLADDMGLGKTLQVIALLLLKRHRLAPDAGKTSLPPSLFVLPASLLSNWKAELARFAPSLKVLLFHPSELRGVEWESHTMNPNKLLEYDVVLTTYGIVLRHAFLQAQSWYLVVLDEAQAIKNPAARQTKAVKKLTGRAKIALTGTPIENHLGDLWSLFDFLCPGLLGSATHFQQYIKTLNQQETPSFAPLRRLVQPYLLRRLKTDKTIINDLPDKTECLGWCGLSKLQAKVYQQAVTALGKALIEEQTGIKRRGLVLAYLLRFKQICNHPAQALGTGDYLIKDSGKFLRLAEIAEEIAQRQEKLLVFTQFREMTTPIATFLETIFGRSGLTLDGKTPVRQRQQSVDEFQKTDGPPFFVLSLKAGGTGLNLTAASHVVHFDRWWNPAVENQATDRAFRIGQKRNVLVHKFVCRGTVEEKIQRMLDDKQQLSQDILHNDGSALLTELDDAALMEMVSLDLAQADYASLG